MLGSDYDSFQEFRRACAARNERTELHTAYTLGKAYSAAHLRYIAEEYCDITEDMIKDASDARATQGLSRRYGVSDLIAGMIPASELGRILCRADHDLHFPVLSYFVLPDQAPCRSLQEFLRSTRTAYSNTMNFLQDTRNLLREFSCQFNGLLRPPGRGGELESILTCPDTDMISLLYSNTRILVAPNGEQGDYNSYFLARIPILVRLLFRYRLIEVSMPTFAEPTGATPSTEKIPERYQKIVRQIRANLQDLLPIALQGIDFGRVTLYLEINLQAQDMGWRIAPQSTADFDLKQRLIPLKTIFDDFQESLDQVCSRREMQSPLAGVNLYKIFRALKEQSYTYAFELNAPIGSRGGSFRISTLYGPPDSAYDPIFWIPKNNDSVAESLHQAIDASRHQHLTNPYDLDSLLDQSS